MDKRDILKKLKLKNELHDKIASNIKKCHPHLKDFDHDEIANYFGVDEIEMLADYNPKFNANIINIVDDYPNKHKCKCKDSSGNYKELYKTYKEAEAKRKLSEYYSGNKLSIYMCPFEDGYHLSKY